MSISERGPSCKARSAAPFSVEGSNITQVEDAGPEGDSLWTVAWSPLFEHNLWTLFNKVGLETSKVNLGGCEQENSQL